MCVAFRQRHSSLLLLQPSTNLPKMGVGKGERAPDRLKGFRGFSIHDFVVLPSTSFYLFIFIFLLLLPSPPPPQCVKAFFHKHVLRIATLLSFLLWEKGCTVVYSVEKKTICTQKNGCFSTPDFPHRAGKRRRRKKAKLVWNVYAHPPLEGGKGGGGGGGGRP